MASPAADRPAADYPAAEPVPEPGERARHWDIRARLSSMLDGRIDAAERFLDAHPFERGLWLVVAFAAGIVLWVALPSRPDWIAALLALGAIAILGLLTVNAETRPTCALLWQAWRSWWLRARSRYGLAPRLSASQA
ncbi:hypothetical protein C7W88_13465 [Novosphingobium sp. THN1]|uniref:hypothetical protein n=1 Tax=Novosphingobium sp. THN1 TaxID=1016987 RepID=UPI000E4E7F13|nr:hypothetical protein [Novosphingobium sp. THN1]AXU19811.1 hypothetical protein C7W88_13465 [Novosphingobium sp. THN1]